MTAEATASHAEPLPSTPVADAVRATTDKLAEHAHVLLHRGGDDEDVHQLRVSARRLRSDLKTFESEVPRDVTAVRRELGWLGRTAGTVRDADVLGGRLRRYSAEVLLTPEDRAAGRVLLEHLEAQRVAGAAEIAAALASDRYDALMHTLDELGQLLAAHRGSLDHADIAESPAALARAARAFLRAAQRLGPDAPDEQLHRVRLRAKQLRYAAEAVGRRSQSAKTLSRAAARIQDVLGDHQDTVMAEQWLRRAAVELPHTGVAAGLLIAAARAERRRCRRFWARGTQLRRIAAAVDSDLTW